MIVQTTTFTIIDHFKKSKNPIKKISQIKKHIMLMKHKPERETQPNIENHTHH